MEYIFYVIQYYFSIINFDFLKSTFILNSPFRNLLGGGEGGK